MYENEFLFFKVIRQILEWHLKFSRPYITVQPDSSSCFAHSMLFFSSNLALSSTRTVTSLPFSAASHKYLATNELLAKR